MTGLSRAGFYRWRVPRQASPVEMELRDEMQKVAVDWLTYGYRRITRELQQRGFEVNHKRLLRMMREDNLLCVRGRMFVVTTDSRHDLPVYPNLARGLTPTAINQLWVADITYSALSSAQFRRVQVPPVVLDHLSAHKTKDCVTHCELLRVRIKERSNLRGCRNHPGGRAPE